MDKINAVSMKNITKHFPGVTALDDVSFDVTPGEVHALVGENGAGKSTLMKILGGVYIPDSGQIFINGDKTSIRSPIDSLSKKISVIYQEFNLVPTLTVSENIFLGKELVTKIGTVDRKGMAQKSQEIINSLGFTSLDVHCRVQSLSVAQQQIVEIAKALFNDSSILVMDEPTTVLTEKESETLFSTINRLKSHGVAIIYISHRLEEVIRISDRITVLRDGKFIIELNNSKKDTSKETIVRHMVGRSLDMYYPERKTNVDPKIVLETKNLSKKGMFNNISFALHKGEILGFFGLVGAGRTELMKTIYGDFALDSGTILINGKEVKIKSPVNAIQRGLALVPENRKTEGLILMLALDENIALPNTKLISQHGYILKNKKRKLAEEFINSMSIRPPFYNKPVEDFSGGNQQKVVVAKWLAAQPHVIIMDEPTRGVDIYAKREIYEIINQMTENGISVIVISSEMSEVMGICDRIMVMHEGELTGEYDRLSVSQEKLMASASGLTHLVGIL
ncbi:MAG: sugar ABC transporter ATP-binding protein [Anaerolineae bacterium]|nr:sugar ABC transporter ATP-binding protein [Anaerolineae bacterium]